MFSRKYLDQPSLKNICPELQKAMGVKPWRNSRLRSKGNSPNARCVNPWLVDIHFLKYGQVSLKTMIQFIKQPE